MTKARAGWVRKETRGVYILRGALPQEPAIALRTYCDRPRDVRSRSACARASVASSGLFRSSRTQSARVSELIAEA
jgi:hypothetical protein